jgi:hypothetical protein
MFAEQRLRFQLVLSRSLLIEHLKGLMEFHVSSLKLLDRRSRPTAGYHFAKCLFLLLPQFFDYILTSSMYMILGPVHFYLGVIDLHAYVI